MQDPWEYTLIKLLMINGFRRSPHENKSRELWTFEAQGPESPEHIYVFVTCIKNVYKTDLSSLLSVST